MSNFRNELNENIDKLVESTEINKIEIIEKGIEVCEKYKNEVENNWSRKGTYKK
ncbi:hypothetical protein CLPU_6c00220 [Gottschalkia purinilytica]|uniref:Uncharacterized protein n=1 Tax=Gottschalkia purinilytica TaxID=1503 RepID=A0A0L0WAM3_GOTPU|nr:hypothetical protein [Gottschalkia purinilytica]KNF08536.1 hypothetical protein CLPU_6c00220 [Gottschalkia purinilytica]